MLVYKLLYNTLRLDTAYIATPVILTSLLQFEDLIYKVMSIGSAQFSVSSSRSIFKLYEPLSS